MRAAHCGSLGYIATIETGKLAQHIESTWAKEVCFRCNVGFGWPREVLGVRSEGRSAHAPFGRRIAGSYPRTG